VDERRPEAIEANILVEQLIAWGIEPARLIIESRARNTHGNAVECVRIVRERGWTRLLVVTSAFHMQRTQGCFRAEGMDVDLLPVDFRAYDPARYNGRLLPRAGAFNQSSNALRELAGRAIYRLQGYSR
jgi:uncharacterized SAM-binding protein YcdF (DUF218 family)